ncbi:MAG: hypothetical protein CM1200mP2_44830 [Planctomycetaceae bacterium]|nr:MAG: hypothetical protein CM1200mP2_44830 [Planctomycetaceae bacterium]
MPGVMFWAYYRSQTEVLPEYLARLSQHYFHKGKRLATGMERQKNWWAIRSWKM